MQRKDEILAKKARLAELKRQREQRSKEFSANRQSIGGPVEVGYVQETSPSPSTDNNGQGSPSQSKTESRKELETLISSLVGEDKGPGTPATPPSQRRTRPSSYAASPSRAPTEEPEGTPQSQQSLEPGAPQALSFAPLRTLYEIRSDPPKREIITYSKGVQTSDPLPPSPSDSDDEEDGDGRRRISSRRQREREEELRSNLRKEIEEELKALQKSGDETTGQSLEDGTKRDKENFPARALTTEELDAVTSSNEFLDFVERSSKVIERALDEEYDVLADYAHGGAGIEDDDGEFGGKGGRKGRRIRETMQFFDERWSRKRIISDISFSPKFPELLLTSHTKNPSAPHDPAGLVLVWNTHMHSRPEYVFQSTSDILTAKFSPFHPNLIVGGSYSGQVLLWDTRNRGPHPVQKTPLTGMGTGHTHPVYSLNVVGTQNAHSITSTSTDGVFAAWSIDVLGQPQEYLELTAPPLLQPATNGSSQAQPQLTRPTDDLSPLTTAFPPSDPTYFLAGTESGAIHVAHRYPRAGYRAGIDPTVLYSGHAAPVVALDFHRPAGPLDLGDLCLSAGLDWSIKLWRVRPPASVGLGALGGGAGRERLDVVSPVLELPRDDAVYDVKWSPAKPGVFAAVDGTGALEVWDLTVDTEVPVARGSPALSANGFGSAGPTVKGRALNKCAWEPHEGRKIAVGGLDGVLSLWEVGGDLGGAESAKAEEWSRMKKLVQKLEGKST